MAEIYRVERYAVQRLSLEVAVRDYALPVKSVCGEAPLVVVGAGVVEVGGRCPGVQLYGVVVVGRLPAHGVVLEDEVAETVEDGPVLVNLQASCDVGAVPDEHVGALVNAGAGEVHKELRRLVAVSAAFVAVYGDHHPVCHASRVSHPFQVVVEVAPVELGADAELLAEREDLVQKDEAGVGVLGNGAGMLEVAERVALRLQAKLLVDAAQGVECGTVNDVRGVEAERVQSGASANIGALLQRASCLGECGGSGDQSDAAIRGVQVGGGAGFAEVAPGARMHKVGVAQVLQVGEQAAFAVVVAMVVGAGDEVDAHPFELAQVLGVGAGECAACHARRVLEVVHEHFEVGEADIGFLEKFSQAHEAVLVEDGHPAGNHRVAAGNECQVTRLRLV